MKGLKSIQDTDMIFKTATRLHESGDVKSALSKYVENLDLMDQTLVPPFRSYSLTQQGIRRCIIEFGNKAYIWTVQIDERLLLWNNKQSFFRFEKLLRCDAPKDVYSTHHLNRLSELSTFETLRRSVAVKQR